MKTSCFCRAASPSKGTCTQMEEPNKSPTARDRKGSYSNPLPLFSIAHNSWVLYWRIMAPKESLWPGVFWFLSLCLSTVTMVTSVGCSAPSERAYPFKYSSWVSNKEIHWTSTNLIFSWRPLSRGTFPLCPHKSSRFTHCSANNHIYIVI